MKCHFIFSENKNSKCRLLYLKYFDFSVFRLLELIQDWFLACPAVIVFIVYGCLYDMNLIQTDELINLIANGTVEIIATHIACQSLLN